MCLLFDIGGCDYATGEVCYQLLSRTISEDEIQFCGEADEMGIGTQSSGNGMEE